MVAQQALTFEECGLLEFYIDQMDFDKHHHNFGTFSYDLNRIAETLGKSKNTIRKWHQSLIHKDFIIPTTKPDIFVIQSYERYSTVQIAQVYTKEEKGKNLEWILDHLNINSKIIKRIAPNFDSIKAISPLDGSSKDLGSFKGKIRVSDFPTEEERVMEALTNSQDSPPTNTTLSERTDTGLPDDDKEWINRNIK